MHRLTRSPSSPRAALALAGLLTALFALPSDSFALRAAPSQQGGMCMPNTNVVPGTCICPGGTQFRMNQRGNMCGSEGQCVCPPNANWNGNQCITCPPGANWNGSQCVMCAGGQQWNGNQCVCPPRANWNGSQCVTCPPNANWNGSQCVSCTGGQRWAGNQCVCPNGTNWNGSQCVSCGGGQQWNGNQCVCPSGANWNGRQCVTCPPNAGWNGNACVVCAGGQQWNGNQCVCPNGSNWNGRQCMTCPPGATWNGSVCVQPPPTCPPGSTWNGSSCVQPPPPPQTNCGGRCGAGQACVNNACVMTGQLQFTMWWDKDGDLDLQVMTPSGAVIFPGGRSADGGRLDVDDTDGTGPENIFWSTNPPAGTYHVCVNSFDIPNNTNFTVQVTLPGGQQQVFRGVRNPRQRSRCAPGQPSYVGSVTVGGAQTSTPPPPANQGRQGRVIRVGPEPRR